MKLVELSANYGWGAGKTPSHLGQMFSIFMQLFGNIAWCPSPRLNNPESITESFPRLLQQIIMWSL